MQINAIRIQGQSGQVEIVRSDRGAYVMEGEICIAAFDRDEGRDSRYAKAQEVARAIFGSDRHGRPAATNSMVHEVMNEIDRIAGC